MKIDFSEIKDSSVLLNESPSKLDMSMNSVIKVGNDDDGADSLNESVISVIKVDDDTRSVQDD